VKRISLFLLFGISFGRTYAVGQDDVVTKLIEANTILTEANVTLSDANAKLMASLLAAQGGQGVSIKDDATATSAKAESAEPRAIQTFAIYMAGRFGWITPTWYEGGEYSHWGNAIAGAVGARLKVSNNLVLRAEGEYSVFWFENLGVAVCNSSGTFCHSQSGDQGVETIMGNLYLDLLTSYKLKPYIGAGCGYMDSKITSFWVDDRRDYGNIYGLYTGVGFNLSKRGGATVDLGMRYLSMRIQEAHAEFISFNAGVRFTF